MRMTETGGASASSAELSVSLDERYIVLDGEHAASPVMDDAALAQLDPSTTVPSKLKLLLVSIDVVAAFAAWLTWGLVADLGAGGALRGAVVGTAATLAALAALRLHRSRTCAVHAVEIVGLGKAVLIAAVIVHAAKGAAGLQIEPGPLVWGGLWAFGALLVGRWAFRAWLGSRRRKGFHLRRVVVVGTNEEGRALVAMLRRNPQAGYQVVGLLGDRHGVANSGVVPWLGPARDTAEVVRSLGANGAFLAASDLAPAQLNATVRELMADGSHVHLSHALRGIAARRVRLQPISREVMFYLEPARLRRWEEATKRAIDVTLASFGLLVAFPVLTLTAIAIRLQDGGPALFRQERVGRGGRHFTLFKLRTMVTDAEARLDAIADRNERDGILFKVDDDPRVTRIGRILRATSLDELPQLLNVLRGEMSLVGPRPALPSEVARFDERLLARHQVTPGVTGLWQVEAREVPDLGAYTRLDLFYVENWSVALDLAIILSTITAVAGRAVRQLTGRPAAPAPA